MKNHNEAENTINFVSLLPKEVQDSIELIESQNGVVELVDTNRRQVAMLLMNADLASALIAALHGPLGDSIIEQMTDITLQ